MEEVLQENPNVSCFHIVICSIATAFAWIATFTILLPLFISLKLSSFLRNKFFSWFFCTVVPNLFPSVQPLRKKLFDLLPEYGKRNLKLLEIGVGGGANFEFYPENCDVTLVDMNENLDAEVRKTLKKYPNIRIEKTVLAMAENMEGVPDSAYDIVLCTHLLCSVRDVDAVLKEVSRVLKPDGIFVYMEHVGFPKTHFVYWIQAILSPLWRVYLNGCNLHRHTSESVTKFFAHNSYQCMYPLFLPIFYRPHIIGISSHSELEQTK